MSELFGDPQVDDWGFPYESNYASTGGINPTGQPAAGGSFWDMIGKVATSVIGAVTHTPQTVPTGSGTPGGATGSLGGLSLGTIVLVGIGAYLILKGGKK